LVQTANYGGYDRPAVPVAQTVECDYRCWHEGNAPLPIGGRLAGRFHKYNPPGVYEAGVWLDANIAVTSSTMVADLLDALAGADVALWRHHQRDTIADEVAACDTLPKYRAVGGRHRDWLADEGDGHGLFELHAFAWQMSTTTRLLLDDVWRATLRYSVPGPAGVANDQILFPAVLARLRRHRDVTVAEMPGNVWVTPWWPQSDGHPGSTVEAP
jgi:hypothetical protein